MVESDTSGEMKKDIANYCFANLVNYLKTQKILKAPEKFDTMKYPLFVTWLKDG